MIPRWPARLPQAFAREGYSFQRGDGRLRTGTATGPGKMRRRTRAVTDPMGGRMDMRSADLSAFWSFFDQDLKGGTVPFLFPDPKGGLHLLVRIGEEMPREAVVAGDWWRLSLALERLPVGSFVPGLPALPAGHAFLTLDGAYVLYPDRTPIIVPVAP